MPPAEAVLATFPTQVAAEPLAPLPVASAESHADVVPAPSRRSSWPSPRPSSPPTSAASTEAAAEDEDISLNDLLSRVLEPRRAPTCTSPPAPARRSALNGELRRSRSYPILTPPVIQRVLYAIAHPEAAGEVRGEPRARLRLHRPGPGPVPRQHLPPAGRARRGLPHHPVRDQEARGPRRAAVGRRTSPMLPRGFVLVTGPTGSGKSTTLAVAGRPGQPHPRTTTS